MSEEFGGLPTELSWKIFIDRYTVKDQERSFNVGDLAVVQTNDDPKWPKKELGNVVSVAEDADRVEVELLTGAERGERLTRKRRECDRPLERSLRDVAERIASGLAAVEPDAKRKRKWTKEFTDEIAALRIVPGGRVWAGAGTGIPLTLFNCYVCPNPEDSRHGIVKTLGQMIEIMSRGGGVGINVSSLRPYRAVVHGVNGRSSGAVSWMELYSLATGLVEQGGSRRGALMLQLDIRHPDWRRFVDCKKQKGKVENANISLRITDEFMAAVKAGADWTFWFPDTSQPDYDTVWTGDFDEWERRGLPKIEFETLPAKEVWDEIIKGAWESAEPGVVFASRHETDSNSWYFNPLVCTNPCAEQPLPAWGVCTLGHINLAQMYDGKAKDVDWDQLAKSTRILVRLLDDVVDATHYFIDENRDNQMNERRIGAGSLGLGELLIKLGLRYGSAEAVEFTERLYRFVAVEAYSASIELAKEKGSFPAFDAEKFLQSGFMKRMPEEIRDEVRELGMRNVTVLTQAPTGTVGTVMDTSTGIEPFYSLKFTRKSRLGLDEQHVRVAQEWLTMHPGKDLPDFFVGAMDLTPEEHIAMQAAVQTWTDSSISKTANAPSDYTLDETSDLYMLAYDMGCKGVTVYRDRSRYEQVLTDASGSAAPTAKDDAANSEATAAEAPTSKPVPAPAPLAKPAAGVGGHVVNGTWGHIRPIPRPKRLVGFTDARETPLGKLFLTLNTLNGHPVELFATIGRAGSDVDAFTDAVARLVSLVLRSGVDPQEVADQLIGIGGSRSVGFGPNRVRSVPDAVGQFLSEMLALTVEDGPRGKAPLVGPVPGSTFATPGDTTQRAETHPHADLDAGDAGPGNGAGNGHANGSSNGHAPASFRHADICPACGVQALIHEEGCVHCYACGYSECCASPPYPVGRKFRQYHIWTRSGGGRYSCTEMETRSREAG